MGNGVKRRVRLKSADDATWLLRKCNSEFLLQMRTGSGK
jgi:hypothetical protein